MLIIKSKICENFEADFEQSHRTFQRIKTKLHQGADVSVEAFNNN